MEMSFEKLTKVPFFRFTQCCDKNAMCAPALAVLRYHCQHTVQFLCRLTGYATDKTLQIIIKP